MIMLLILTHFTNDFTFLLLSRNRRNNSTSILNYLGKLPLDLLI